MACGSSGGGGRPMPERGNNPGTEENKVAKALHSLLLGLLLLNFPELCGNQVEAEVVIKNDKRKS